MCESSGRSESRSGPRHSRANGELSARLAGKGYSSGTIQSYRRNLQLFFKEYPSGEIRPDSAARWREKLLAQGLMPSTVKLRISSVNGLLAFLELWKYQAKPPPWPNTEEVQPELTRSEYLRLLSAARALGKEQVYLLVKVFACTGVRVQDLPQVTVEAVQEGRLLLHKQLVSLPPSLCDELLSYAGKKGVSHGSLFVTRNGKPLSRTNVTALVQRLAGAAGCLLRNATLAACESSIKRPSGASSKMWRFSSNRPTSVWWNKNKFVWVGRKPVKLLRFTN